MMPNFSETSNEEFPKPQSKEKTELCVAPTQQMGSDFQGIYENKWHPNNIFELPNYFYYFNLKDYCYLTY